MIPQQLVTIKCDFSPLVMETVIALTWKNERLGFFPPVTVEYVLLFCHRR